MFIYIAVVHDSHCVHLQQMDEKRNQMRGERSTGIEYRNGLVCVGQRGTFIITHNHTETCRQWRTQGWGSRVPPENSFTKKKSHLPP